MAVTTETIPLITVAEAASRASVCTKTIYKALGDGQLIGSKLRSIWRIRSSDLEAWIDACQRGVRQPPAGYQPRRDAPIPKVGSLDALRRIEADAA
jgi:excisionase family DNA binding protein